MKNKMLALLGAVVISAGTIGGIAFASSASNNNPKENQQAIVKENSINTNQTSVENTDIKVKNNVKERSNNDNINYNQNSANVKSKDIYQDMTKIMRDNGFNEAARYMQNGDYDAMTNYMNTLSQEDYDKMIDIMNDNGYGYMGQMMKSIGRENMTKIHNSMMSTSGRGGNGRNYNNMMGGF